MKNKTPYIVIAILFVIYNVIAFVIPTTKTSAFWICYAFTVISFAVQAYVWYATIGKKQDLKVSCSAHRLHILVRYTLPYNL